MAIGMDVVPDADAIEGRRESRGDRRAEQDAERHRQRRSSRGQVTVEERAGGG
jgi:hypothetical protein